MNSQSDTKNDGMDFVIATTIGGIMKSITLLLVLFTSLLSYGQRFERPERPERPVPPGRQDRLVNVSLGSVQTNKLITETRSFRPQIRNERIFRLEIVGIKGISDIQSVVVHYQSGYSEVISGFRGGLKEGRRMNARIYSDYVREIQVTATSGLIGTRGQYEVIAGVLRR